MEEGQCGRSIAGGEYSSFGGVDEAAEGGAKCFEGCAEEGQVREVDARGDVVDIAKDV